MKWFKHDSNASRDAKLEKLIMKYGVEGYGLYWYCIEIIAGELSIENITFELEHDSEILAYKLKMDSRKVEEIMAYCIHLNLFDINPDTNRVRCMALAKRVDEYTAKNPEIMKIKNSIVKQLPIVSGQNHDSVLPDKIRLDKIRLDKNKDNNKEFSFEVIYNKYPRREGQKQAEKYFKTTVKTQIDWDNINKALSNYMNYLYKNKIEAQFIKMASTWFNNWQDWVNWQDPKVPIIKNKKNYIVSEFQTEEYKKAVEKGHTPENIAKIREMVEGIGKKI